MAVSDGARRKLLFVIFGLLTVGAAVIVAAGLRRPPQMGVDEKTFKTVDALYTAVRNQDTKRLGECERRLHDYREAGQLPPAAAGYLDEVIRTARAGDWETATRRLYDFMRVQRREAA